MVDFKGQKCFGCSKKRDAFSGGPMGYFRLAVFVDAVLMGNRLVALSNGRLFMLPSTHGLHMRTQPSYQTFTCISSIFPVRILLSVIGFNRQLLLSNIQGHYDHFRLRINSSKISAIDHVRDEGLQNGVQMILVH